MKYLIAVMSIPGHQEAAQPGNIEPLVRRIAQTAVVEIERIDVHERFHEPPG